VLLSIASLIFGLVLVIKGADYLVMGASSMAKRFQISDFVIGLTVVSFGTSLPELVIALAAGGADSPGLILGNVVGSNIANILLVLGVSAAIYPLAATVNTVWREIPFTLLASVVLIVLLNDQVLDKNTESALRRSDGLILLGFFVAFVYYVAQVIKGEQQREWVGESAHHSVRRAVFEFVGGLAGLIIGARFTVHGAVDLAQRANISDALIGLTIIAIGTSLPELATSAMAAYRKNADIAVGNVVGSNIFNIFIVLGLSSLAYPIPFDAAYNFDLGVMVGVTILLFVFMFVGHPRRTIQRHEGVLFVALYAAYIGYVAWRG
jgi:cation:H+ antiporter